MTICRVASHFILFYFIYTFYICLLIYFSHICQCSLHFWCLSSFRLSAEVRFVIVNWTRYKSYTYILSASKWTTERIGPSTLTPHETEWNKKTKNLHWAEHTNLNLVFFFCVVLLAPKNLTLTQNEITFRRICTVNQFKEQKRKEEVLGLWSQNKPSLSLSLSRFLSVCCVLCDVVYIWEMLCKLEYKLGKKIFFSTSFQMIDSNE